MSKKVCSFEGCESPVFSKKLCKFHTSIRTSKEVKKKSDSKVGKTSKRAVKPSKTTYKRINFSAPEAELEKFSNSVLKRVSDYCFRKVLLNRVERNGQGKIFCPLKRRWFSEGEMDVAHWIDRGTMATRYSFDNCHLISSQSNQWDAAIPHKGYKSKHHYDYETWLGEDKVNVLKELSKQIVRMKKEDYIELILKLRREYE